MADTSLGWPVCCGCQVSVDMDRDPPIGVCDSCGLVFPIEGEVEETEITIADLLGDASQVLKDTGKPALARAVRVARDTFGGGQGETWVADIAKVLDEAERVIEAARSNPDRVVLDPLAQAIDECSSWGLNPYQRAKNALRELIVALVYIEAQVNDKTLPETRLAVIGQVVKQLIEGLGIGQDQE